MKNYNALTNKEYTKRNQSILEDAREEFGFNSYGWVTLKQANEMGKKVKKGATATRLFFTKFNEVIEKNENGEEEEKTLKLFKAFYVFNLDQLEDREQEPTKETKEETNESEEVAEVEESKEEASEVKEVAKVNYKPFNDELERIANSHSFYSRGTNLKNEYNAVAEKINANEYISLENKQKLMNKWEQVFGDYANKSAYFVSPMVSGISGRNTRKMNKEVDILNNKSNAVLDFKEKYKHILENKAPKQVDNNNLLFECNSYKVIKYTLESGAERVGFVFYSKIARQLAVALKSRGFRWNALQKVWGTTLEKYNEFKEWSETLEQNYNKYLIA